MKHAFSTPTTDEAARLLSLVPYRQRFMMGRLNWPAGWTSTPARSLNEVHIFLQTGEKSFPAVQVPSLIAWVDEVVGDRELARALRSCQCEVYVDHCDELREVIGERLAQLRGVAGDELPVAQPAPSPDPA